MACMNVSRTSANCTFAVLSCTLHDLAETRLIPLAFPVGLGVLSTVLFGAGYAHPEKFHWFVIIFSYCGSYFAFSKC
jgi:hypothetical protein